MNKRHTYLSITLISGLIILANCSSSVTRKDIQNLPPLVEIVVLDVAQNTLKLRVSHRHQISRKDNKLSCQLAIQDLAPLKIQQTPLPDLTTFATETTDISINTTALSESGKLNKELPYVLDCFLFSENFRKEQVLKKGVLYKVPGSLAAYR